MERKVNVSSKGKQYILFKDNQRFEKYLIRVSNFIMIKSLNIEQAIIGSQLRLEGGMIRH